MGEGKETEASLSIKERNIRRAYHEALSTLDIATEGKYYDIIKKKRLSSIDEAADQFNDDGSIDLEKYFKRVGDISNLDFIEQLHTIHERSEFVFWYICNLMGALAQKGQVHLEKRKHIEGSKKIIDKWFGDTLNKFLKPMKLHFPVGEYGLEMFLNMRIEGDKIVARTRKRVREEEVKVEEAKEEIASAVENVNNEEEKSVSENMQNKENLGDLSNFEGLEDSFNELASEVDVPKDVINAGIDDVDAEALANAQKELENVATELDKVGDEAKAPKTPLTEEEKERQKRAREAKKHRQEAIERELTATLSAVNGTDEQKELEKKKEMVSQHVVSLGFLNGYNDKIVPAIKTIKGKTEDGVEKAPEYKFIFRNQKPSRETHAILKGPKALLDRVNMDLTEEKLRQYKSKGLVVEKGKPLTLNEDDIKNQIVTCLSMKDLNAFLLALTTDRGIAEHPELTDMVFGKKYNENGEKLEDTRIIADISTYAKNKVALSEVVNKIADLKDHPEESANATEELAMLAEKRKSLQNLIEKKESSGNIAQVKASNRAKSRLVTRTNYIPSHIYDTVNIFSSKFDTICKDLGRPYHELISGSLTVAEGVTLVNQQVVCEDGKHIKLFEISSKVSIEDKKTIYDTAVDTKAHWYTGKPLAYDELNVVVRKPTLGKDKEGKEKERFIPLKHELNFTGNLEHSPYTVEKIENQNMLKLVGRENLKEFIRTNKLVSTKASGGRTSTSKINSNIIASLRLDALEFLQR